MYRLIRLQRYSKIDKSVVTMIQFAINKDQFYNFQEELIRRVWQHHVAHPHKLCKYWYEDVELPAIREENQDHIIRGEN